MNLTFSQQEAIAARGNVLVVAGAGTGKTSTLVERCLDCLLHEKPPASLDEILMVTFTDAAAAEMRQRIRIRLEEQLEQHPENLRWHEQLAIFETAHIGTLHSFCLQLVRQHFYALDLDPQFSVLPAEEARLLAHETLEALLQKHYTGRTPEAKAVQQLIQAQARGSDQPIRVLVLRLHHYTQTLPDPAGWFREQLESFATPDPTRWHGWLLDALAEWRRHWVPMLGFLKNEIAEKCLAALKKLPARSTRAEAVVALEAILAACQNCPRGKKTEWLKPLKDFLAEAEFLLSLTRADGKVDPLAEDWGWVRPQMTTILQLTQEFGDAFSETKRELGMVDFHDLEQHALRLLWDAKANQPTKVARQWGEKLRFVFVDEYQDINAAQDKIIEALSREGAQANRFLVGDVKQSIYRFRLADPYIFQAYVKTWGNGQGKAISLVENFRSREAVLGFINSLFTVIMQPEIGGVHYDKRAQLQFGAPEERGNFGIAGGSAPCVELHLRLKGGPNNHETDEENAEALATVAEMEEADKEARLVALRLRELKAQGHQIWDQDKKIFRAVEWSDMAILLRAPSNKAESYAKEFSRLNVPLLVERGGFYESMEILDLLSLLQLLDNPLQDLPTLAVLHSPLVGLTLNELATIRLTTKGHFWTALARWQEGQQKVPSDGCRVRGEEESGETFRKVTAFLERFGRWRRLARQVSLSRCLETVLSETHYAAWLLTQPRGQQRHANVQRLIGLARQFDQFQRQGLFRFLRFIEAQKSADTEPEVAAVSEENSVRLMSIHQSKGLEFPVVVVADLGKPFNVSDLRADVILDEQYGLCPQIKPPHTGKRYPSLPYWLARQRQHREMLGEELRLLYVATTRARDTLILSGSVSKPKFEKVWKQKGEPSTQTLLSAGSYSDWLGLWFSHSASLGDEAPTEGQNAHLRWIIHDDTKLIGPGAEPANAESDPLTEVEPSVWQSLQQRLSWEYPFSAATRKPAKTSVSILRRRATADSDEQSSPLFPVQGSRFTPHVPRPTLPISVSTSLLSAKASAADVGTAHHTFLQLVSLERVGSVEELRSEAERLAKEGAMTDTQIAVLDFEGLAAFWQSDVGRKVRAQAKHVERELAFTVRCAANALAGLAGQPLDQNLDDEFVIVQGAADLAVLLPQEIWLIDFKTDAVGPAELADKVKWYEPQLKLYAQALSRIYGRPVSQSWLYFLAARTAVPMKLVS